RDTPPPRCGSGTDASDDERSVSSADARHRSSSRGGGGSCCAGRGSNSNHDAIKQVLWVKKDIENPAVPGSGRAPHRPGRATPAYALGWRRAILRLSRASGFSGTQRCLVTCSRPCVPALLMTTPTHEDRFRVHLARPAPTRPHAGDDKPGRLRHSSVTRWWGVI